MSLERLGGLFVNGKLSFWNAWHLLHKEESLVACSLGQPGKLRSVHLGPCCCVTCAGGIARGIALPGLLDDAGQLLGGVVLCRAIAYLF